MERWSEISEHPILNLWLRKVFWECNWKAVSAPFFITFSALLSVIAHRFLFLCLFVCYRRDLFWSWLSSEKTVQLPSFLHMLIIFNLHYTYRLLGIRYYKYNSNSLMTFHPKAYEKSLCNVSLQEGRLASSYKVRDNCLYQQSRPYFVLFLIFSWVLPSSHTLSLHQAETTNTR